MRVAVVSDIHGNLLALEAVIADLAGVRPDVIVNGGDLALGGPRPVEVVDRIRELGWPSVRGNTDAALDQAQMPERAQRGFVGAPAARTRELLGEDRVHWLSTLPMEWRGDDIAVVHAAPGDCWKIIDHDAPDETLRETFAPLNVATAVYGHIHHAYVRQLDGLTVTNSGSVSLALDGDVRAAYAVIDGGRVTHRRVAYDANRVAAEMIAMRYPQADAYAAWLKTGRFD